jgi:hypothetical protein
MQSYDISAAIVAVLNWEPDLGPTRQQQQSLQQQRATAHPALQLYMAAPLLAVCATYQTTTALV